jgi:hypothetical protein
MRNARLATIAFGLCFTLVLWAAAHAQIGPGPGSGTANPSATAGPAAINGSATTSMRSDGTPAIQLGTAAQKGILQVDGVTITAAAGIISGNIVSGTSVCTSCAAGGVLFNASGVISSSGGLTFTAGNGSTTSLLTLGTNANLLGEAANVLALRNGTNPQGFRVYNTFTDATHNEFAEIQWSSNNLVIGSNNNNGTARAVQFEVGGNVNLTLMTNGLVNNSAGYNSNSTSVNNYVMNSTGSNNGTMTNTGADSWCLGYAVSTIVKGTCVATWTDNGAVTIAPNSGVIMLGSGTALTGNTGEVGMPKITASASAPGAAGAKFEWVCGTGAGSQKLIAYGGTSTTPVTIVDNVGTGATGC